MKCKIFINFKPAIKIIFKYQIVHSRFELLLLKKFKSSKPIFKIAINEIEIKIL